MRGQGCKLRERREGQRGGDYFIPSRMLRIVSFAAATRIRYPAIAIIVHAISRDLPQKQEKGNHNHSAVGTPRAGTRTC